MSESEANFLGDAARTLSRLASEVAAFPPRSFLDFGSSWGQQFEPIYAQFGALMDRGRAYLAPGSEARAQFTASMNEFNKMLGRAQNAEEGWLDAATRFARSPLMFTYRAAVSVASASAEGAVIYAEEGAEAAASAVKDALAALPWGKIALAAGAVGLLLVAGGRR